MRHYLSDHAGSDDMVEILEMSLATASGSGSISNTTSSSTPAHVNAQDLRTRLTSLDEELRGVEGDISQLEALRGKLRSERQDVLNRLQEAQNASRIGANDLNGNHSSEVNGIANRNGKGKQRALDLDRDAGGGVDYMSDKFEWSGELRARMKSVFGIENFRLCQEGVCNANMDGRDIVCVMPTGGGKSLTYQLPALLNPGCTIVISPLIALITDQVMHLREAGVEAAMLTSSTSKEEMRDVYARLTSSSRAAGAANGIERGREIKLCYVTPEKISKSKSFVSMLEKMAAVGRLARIVIDEAHCVSQMGHDFRPDYKKLSILRQLFPRVPILALSATCPPKVLKDLLVTLRMKAVVDSRSNSTDGTVLFTAPLYRKNLHYKILPKPASASAVIQAMVDYILKEHKGDSGIVYCLSRKDAETVAAGLAKTSNGAIRTGVYHSDVPDKQKEALHRRWRAGEVKVVCATIAFGLGIDKGDVRFVLHHSMSKSLDGYYQESGRAGRDGNDSDCILYYRPQDATRLSALICGELEGQDKLQEMLRFAQDVVECRKVLFAKYFSASSSLSISSWTTSDTSALSPCGHCDNCQRPADSIMRKDVTLETWRILRVMQTIERDSGRVTMSMLADLVRGAGGGAYGVANANGKGKRRKSAALSKEKISLDLDAICDGKVGLSKDETESLLVQLILSGHLKESFHSTAYAINVYVLTGENALRVLRCKREDIENGKGQRVEICFTTRKGAKKTKKSAPSAVRIDMSRGKKAANGRQEVHVMEEDISDEHEVFDIPEDDEEEDDVDDIDADDPEHDESGWAFSMHANPKAHGDDNGKRSESGRNDVKRRRVEINGRETTAEHDSDVIVLSD